MQNLPIKSLLTIYKAFLRPHIDYSNVIYDQPSNESFCERHIKRKEISEAAIQRCSEKQVFWKYAADLQENTHAEVRFQ